MNRFVFITAVTFLLAMASGARADPINVALGKPYAYFDRIPGEGPFYQDDWLAVHAVHSGGGFGAYDTGDLTDGILQPGTGAAANIPSPVVMFGKNAYGRIVFDLQESFQLESMDLGTHRVAGLANFRPETVNLNFSETATTPGDFTGSPVFWDIPTDSSEGQTTFSFDFPDVTARYVLVDFLTSGGQPVEIHFDEVRLFGSAAVIPEPTSLALWSLLAAVGAGCGWRRRGRKK